MKNWEREAGKLNAEVGATLNRLQAAHERIASLEAALRAAEEWMEELSGEYGRDATLRTIRAALAPRSERREGDE